MRINTKVVQGLIASARLQLVHGTHRCSGPAALAQRQTMELWQPSQLDQDTVE